jgi:hypothetical protein
MGGVQILNKKAGVAIELLVLLITIVATSAIVLVLVSTGVLSVKAQPEVNLLNAEFVPLGRQGFLAIKNFEFCEDVTDEFKCVNSKKSFNRGSNVYFRFTVDTTVYDGNVALIENYQIKDSAGKVLLNVDENNNYHVDFPSKDLQEDVSFSDYFTAGYALEPGEYTLDLEITNTLLDKKTTLSERFVLE